MIFTSIGNDSHQLRRLSRLLVLDRLQSLQHRNSFFRVLVMSKLTPESIGAGIMIPKVGASLLSEMLVAIYFLYFMNSVGEFTLISVVAIAHQRIFLAHFCFVFEGICQLYVAKVELFVPLLAAVALCG